MNTFKLAVSSALLATSVVALREDQSIEELSTEVTCPVHAPAYGFKWHFQARNCLMCNPHKVWDEVVSKTLSASVNPDDDRTCQCTPNDDTARVHAFEFRMQRGEACSNVMCIEKLGRLLLVNLRLVGRMGDGQLPTFGPAAFDSEFQTQQCKACNGPSPPADCFEKDLGLQYLQNGIPDEVDPGLTAVKTNDAAIKEGLAINPQFFAPSPAADPYVCPPSKLMWRDTSIEGGWMAKTHFCVEQDSNLKIRRSCCQEHLEEYKLSQAMCEELDMVACKHTKYPNSFGNSLITWKGEKVAYPHYPEAAKKPIYTCTRKYLCTHEKFPEWTSVADAVADCGAVAGQGHPICTVDMSFVPAPPKDVPAHWGLAA